MTRQAEAAKARAERHGDHEREFQVDVSVGWYAPDGEFMARAEVTDDRSLQADQQLVRYGIDKSEKLAIDEAVTDAVHTHLRRRGVR